MKMALCRFICASLLTVNVLKLHQAASAYLLNGIMPQAVYGVQKKSSGQDNLRNQVYEAHRAMTENEEKVTAENLKNKLLGK